MLFIVIDRFKSREAAAEVYRRLEERGRMLPDGLKHLDSWVEENLDRCFQLMETDDAKLFKQWIAC
jgi:DNA-binding HxlR family transcriptional regulator